MVVICVSCSLTGPPGVHTLTTLVQYDSKIKGRSKGKVAVKWYKNSTDLLSL